eukprot:1151151-Prymnesium_polylepis.1
MSFQFVFQLKKIQLDSSSVLEQLISGTYINGIGSLLLSFICVPHAYPTQEAFGSLVATVLACPAGVWINRQLQKYDRDTSHLKESKEDIIATTRLVLLDSTPCKVMHCVRTPSMVGKSGIVVGNGVDDAGLVTIEVSGITHKMQEHQLAPDRPAEEQVTHGSD